MYKFLLIEDSSKDVSSFQDTIKRLNIESGEELYALETAQSYSEAEEKLSGIWDGVIVDIKLDEEHSGNAIIKEIIDNYRIPTCIFTGTPDTNQEENSPILVYKKGEASHEEIVTNLREVVDTGVFNVLGGTGVIETILNRVFWDNLYPQINTWKEKKRNGIDTEKILLRYALGHIQEIVDYEYPEYVTEEMYIKPPINKGIKTGSIVQSDKGKYYIVLSPPCDLAKHNDRYKTDSILICEIEEHNKTNRKEIEEVVNKDKKIRKIKNIISNNDKQYLHWLPNNTLFEGGYINFRKATSFPIDQFFSMFGEPIVSVQDYFVKNILNRFSSYYSRQGQPDFNFDIEAKAIVENIAIEDS